MQEKRRRVDSKNDVFEILRKGFAGVSPPHTPAPIDVAVRVVYETIQTELEPIKLQKLLFFAHAIALAIFGAPLVQEPFEAWPYGPVVNSVYEVYHGWLPLPLKKQPSTNGKTSPSEMVTECIRLAVAAHGSDSASEIKWKSHANPVWKSLKAPRKMHVKMPNSSLKDWFERPEVILVEVLPGLLPNTNHEILDGVAACLAREEMLRSELGYCISAESARVIDSRVVIWPNQPPVNALFVARQAPENFYNVLASQFQEGTTEYLVLLAEMAGLGDWVAIARLASLVEDIDIEHMLAYAKLGDDAANGREYYAFGTFRFLVGDVDGATMLWKSSESQEAQVSLAGISDADGSALSQLGDAGEPYAAFAKGDLATLRRLADESIEAKHCFGILAAESTGYEEEGRQSLLGLALCGHELACTTLFNTFPFATDFPEEDLESLAKVTQGGRLALATLHGERGNTQKAKELFDQVDVLSKFTAHPTSDGIAEEADKIFNSIRSQATGWV